MKKDHFTDLNDFVTRVCPGLEQLILLIKAGAFRFTGKKKSVLLWEAHMMINKNKHEETRPLFSPPVRDFSLPDLVQGKLEDVYDEIELFGFPVTMSWFDMLETSFRGDVSARRMSEYTGKKIRMVGHLVTVKYIKTIKNDWMNFGCFIDSEGNFFDTTHFSNHLRTGHSKEAAPILSWEKLSKSSAFPRLRLKRWRNCLSNRIRGIEQISD